MGLDFDIDVRGLPYDFIVTSVVRAVGDNVTVLPDEAVNTQDYALAADYCISKAGWSSVAELMLAGARTALLLRPGVAEDMFTINELGSRNEAVAITVDELRDMGSLMKKLEHAALKKPGYINGYMKAADIISG